MNFAFIIIHYCRLVCLLWLNSLKLYLVLLWPPKSSTPSLNKSNEAVFDIMLDDVGLWKVGLGLPKVLQFCNEH